MASLTESGSSTKHRDGFTILELLVVMAIIGTLLSLAAPHYFRSIEKAEHAALKENLSVLRSTIDRFHADADAYPSSLDELVRRGYLRRIPADPLTGSAATWIVVPAPSRAGDGVADVRSGAPGTDRSGVAFREW